MEDNTEIMFETDPSEVQEEDLNNEESARQILSQASQPTIRGLFNDNQRGRLLLSPDFQRHFVWDQSKATKLVESVLLGIPLPVIYLAEEAGGKKTVIDGQQRLTALFSFLSGSFPSGRIFKLGKMSLFSDLQGKRFSDLPDEWQAKIDDTAISCVTFLRNCDPELKFNVFERLNTGAVALNDQELRNCIYRGPYNELLKRLAEDQCFRDVLGLSGAEKRMFDVELVLRFAAFYHKNYLDYKPSIKRFLNEDMRRWQHISSSDAQSLENAFKCAVSLAKSLFGDRAFRRFCPGTEHNRDGNWEPKKFNVSIYDVLMWTLARKDKNLIMRNLDAIRESFIDAMTSDQDFIDAITRSTSSTACVNTRFRKWSDRLEAVLSGDTVQNRCFSRELKQRLFDTNPTCAICGQAISCLDDAAVDHIEQYWCGGRTIPNNARLAHRYCNCARSRLS